MASAKRSQERELCYLPRCPLGERGRGPVDLGSIDAGRVDVGVVKIKPVEIEQGGIKPGDAEPCASSRGATATSEVPVTAAALRSVAPRW
jgi:hypothetical protein